MPAGVIAKEPCYLRSERSPAFIRYCERVHGAMLNQYGTADIEQLTLMLDALRLRPGSHVLDAGCGTWHTTRYLAEKSEARFVGIDTLEPAIGRAQHPCPRRPVSRGRDSERRFDRYVTTNLPF